MMNHVDCEEQSKWLTVGGLVVKHRRGLRQVGFTVQRLGPGGKDRRLSLVAAHSDKLNDSRIVDLLSLTLHFLTPCTKTV